jgi:hypothetical protein
MPLFERRDRVFGPPKRKPFITTEEVLIGETTAENMQTATLGSPDLVHVKVYHQGHLMRARSLRGPAITNENLRLSSDPRSTLEWRPGNTGIRHKLRQTLRRCG